MAYTTELQAVNFMLAVIGEAPVSSISSTLPEAQKALTVLREVSQEFQSGDWYFNREDKYRLTPTGGYLVVPDNVLFCDSSWNNDQVIQRGNRLYDKGKHTYTFELPLGYYEVDVVWCFAWEDLPEQARTYIKIVAARRFQKQELGSDTLDAFTKEDEAKAFLNFQRYDSSLGDFNILDADDLQYINRQ